MLTNVIPGEFGGAARVTAPPPESPGIRMLCVSTLEPRKNHLRLLEACRLLAGRHPDLDWQLTLVGKTYSGALEIADAVEEAAAADPRIRWAGVVDDETLSRLYQEASFSVYPSEIEGFGMPILESLWHGRPSLCANQGVMAELAAEGGCLTADVTSAESLYEAIASLAFDPGLRRRLAGEASGRKLKTWSEYVGQLLALLEQCRAAAAEKAGPPPDLDPQRALLAGALAELNPRAGFACGVDRNTLEILAAHARKVFVLDGALEAAPPNAVFLGSGARALLPELVRETHPDFVCLGPAQRGLLSGLAGAASPRRVLLIAQAPLSGPVAGPAWQPLALGVYGLSLLWLYAPPAEPRPGVLAAGIPA
jgi:hypothetical protein